MNERMELVQFVEGNNGKKFPRRKGSAVPRKNGEGWTLYVELDWGTLELVMQPPRDREAAAPSDRRDTRDDDRSRW